MYARVAVARPLGGPLTYAIPAMLHGQLCIGQVVVVPLGPRGETGYIVGFTEELDFDVDKLKPISRLVDPVPAFDARQFEFFQWIADYYMASLGVVIHTALPSEVQARVTRVLVPTDEGIEALTRREVDAENALVLRETIARPGLTRRGLVGRLSAEADPDVLDRAVEKLLKRGLVTWADREQKEAHARLRTATLTRSVDDALAAVPTSGTRMRTVIGALGAGAVDVRELTAAQGATVGSALKKLEKLGLVRIGEREDRSVRLDDVMPGPVLPPALNADQQAALAALDGATGPHLLFGVTGSGKTEVFLGAARSVLDRGRQVLVLVPEIGLTPQLVGRFRARFGDGVAVLHSGLSGGERLAWWRRIRAGEANVAVGARSALFAPFRDLGLVVVDEEHDDSYKQDDGVRYHARDLAVVLARLHGGSAVLASATPSLESWYNASNGRYKLLRLPKRATPRAVPSIDIVDLTAQDVPEGVDRPLFAPEVVDALRSALNADGKAIVLYNRRGFATMVQCTDCGATYECPNCGITMTLHQQARVIACHYCGLKRSYDGRCPACHKPTLQTLGKGTERVEEVLASLFPDAPIARMDADTTAVRGSHHKILTEFRSGKARLLVGTQIVAKGHDFPDVHVAVVVSADHGLRMPDFRAAERTYALLVQMAGRAGRGDVAGRVLLQTWAPDHYVLHHLDDVEAFYVAELKIRKTLRYPPFTRLCLVRLDGVDRGVVEGLARGLAHDLRGVARSHATVEVLGPALAAMARLVGRWRVQIVLRGREVRVWLAFLRAVRPLLEAAPRLGVRLAIDVDPRNLM